MPMCCVYQCSNRGGFHFPKDVELRKKWQHAVRRENGFVPKDVTVVCSAHFTQSDFVLEGAISGLPVTGRRRLKKTACPSVFPWTACNEDRKKSDLQRADRALKRNLKFEPPAVPQAIVVDNTDNAYVPIELVKSDYDHNKIVGPYSGDVDSVMMGVNCVSVVPARDSVSNTVCDEISADSLDGREGVLRVSIECDVPEEEVVTSKLNNERDDSSTHLIENPTPSTSSRNEKKRLIIKQHKKKKVVSQKVDRKLGKEVVSTQSQTEHHASFSILRFKDKPDVIAYYTGLESFEKFLVVFCSLGPAVHRLTYRDHSVVCLSPEDQLFLTLIKLRRNKPDFELAIDFDISRKTVGNIFVTWIKFMALEWSECNIWPTKDLVLYYMPEGFRNSFPSTRVILDGTEFPIEKPKNSLSQQISWSNYKNRNTLQTLVGISPGGLISHVSPAYGGSVSDRALVERSDLLHKCDEQDTIMADRGFTVEDIFIPKNIGVNIPTFVKGQSQLPGMTLLRDRKLASKRVHVERLIGLTKTYKILRQEMRSYYVPIGSEIFFVCAMLCNFREGIVGKEA